MTVGLSPTLVVPGMTVMGAVTIDWPPLLVYGVSGVLAYVLGLAAVYVTLRFVRDQFASRTTRRRERVRRALLHLSAVGKSRPTLPGELRGRGYPNC